MAVISKTTKPELVKQGTSSKVLNVLKRGFTVPYIPTYTVGTNLPVP